MLVFVVGRNFIEMAIGRDNYNLKKISDILGRRIRVLPEPTSEKDLKKFVQILVYPVEFENIEIMNNIETKEKEALITTSGREPRAMLIGRGRIREKELKEILEQYFQVKNIRIN
jgi:transcription antitermination factor NusA-like protein